MQVDGKGHQLDKISPSSHEEFKQIIAACCQSASVRLYKLLIIAFGHLTMLAPGLTAGEAVVHEIRNELVN